MNQPDTEPTLHGLFRGQAARTPDALAVVTPSRALGYRKLDLLSDQLAAQISGRGAQPGCVVALSLARSTEQMIAVLAVLKAGAACLPLDPAYPRELLSYMLADARASLVITDQPDAIPHGEVPVLLIDGATFEETDASTPQGSAPLCYVLYTSGSTGRPKGIAMPHRAIVNLAGWHRVALPLSAEERVLQFTTLSFDVAFQEIFTTWSEGGTLVLMNETLRRDPRALWQFLSEQKISRLFLPYVALQQLAASADLANLPPLRDVITAGEQLRITPEIRALFIALPECKLHNHYGPAETHVVTAFTLAGPAASWPALPPIGVPISGVTIELLDDFRQAVPPGSVGEIYVRGACLADGYVGKPELTAERFWKVRGERFYRTGDLARMIPDGTLAFLGRADTQIKVRGFRVELGEIELQLAEHPAVRECAVAGDDERLVAYWVGGPCASSQLREFLAGKLAPHLVPSAFVQLRAIPLTPSGKIDRRALPARAAEGQERQSRLPTGELEKKIAGIWRTVLGISEAGAEDNFFDLGGTSLSVVRAHQLLNAELQRELDVTTLFQFPTIGALARHLNAERGSSLRDHAQSRAELQRGALARRRAAAPSA